LRRVRGTLIAAARLFATSPRWAAALTLVAVLAGHSPVPGYAKPRAPGPVRAIQTGYASWYGEPHHGRRTASGETFHMHSLTAAHPTLPMGTRLLVTNLRNGRAVEVRVNDRGPVVRGRILDLSFAAARNVRALSDGVFPVRLHIVATPSP
jgi:rare lipoprotein A